MTAPTAATRGYTTISQCRLCKSTDLVPLFSLGNHRVSGFLDGPGLNPPPRVPIDICLCRNCKLVQQRHTADQDFLYTRHYWYRSSLNPAMSRALRDVVQAANDRANVRPGDVVLDVGANDGCLLSHWADFCNDLTRVAVEPATNIAKECRKQCEIFVNDFWGADSLLKAWNEYRINKNLNCDEGGTDDCACPPRRFPGARVVTALGMLYDIEDPCTFVSDITKVLAPDGIFISQLMCLKQTLLNNDVGNFCHEHLSFFSLDNLRRLFGQAGLEIFDVEENAVNGGSYRLYARHVGTAVGGPKSQRVMDASWLEEKMDLGDPDTYKHWFAELAETRAKVRAFVEQEARAGKRFFVLGASTKGNTILQWLGLGSQLNPPPDSEEEYLCAVTGASDRSPEKWHKYMVGSNVCIFREETMRSPLNEISYAIVLPYAFLDELVEREQAWLAGGGKFLVPMPKPVLVGTDGKKVPL